MGKKEVTFPRQCHTRRVLAGSIRITKGRGGRDGLTSSSPSSWLHVRSGLAVTPCHVCPGEGGCDSAGSPWCQLGDPRSGPFLLARSPAASCSSRSSCSAPATAPGSGPGTAPVQRPRHCSLPPSLALFPLSFHPSRPLFSPPQPSGEVLCRPQASCGFSPHPRGKQSHQPPHLPLTGG